MQLPPQSELVTSSEEAVRRLIASLLSIKERGLNLSEERNTKEFADELGRLASFLKLHHALLPPTGWEKVYVPAYNRLVGAIQTHFSPSQSPDTLQEVYVSTEVFLGAIDKTLALLAERETRKDMTNHSTIIYGNVGFINHGQVRANTITGIATHLRVIEDKMFSSAVAELVKAVSESAAITANARDEILEQIEDLVDQAALPKDKRKAGRVKATLEAMAMALSASGGLAETWATWGPAIRSMFG